MSATHAEIEASKAAAKSKERVLQSIKDFDPDMAFYLNNKKMVDQVLDYILINLKPAKGSSFFFDTKEVEFNTPGEGKCVLLHCTDLSTKVSHCRVKEEKIITNHDTVMAAVIYICRKYHGLGNAFLSIMAEFFEKKNSERKDEDVSQK